MVSESRRVMNVMNCGTDVSRYVAAILQSDRGLISPWSSAIASRSLEGVRCDFGFDLSNMSILAIVCVVRLLARLNVIIH